MHLKDYVEKMKVVAILNKRHLQVNILETVPKHTAKKQVEHIAVVTTLACRPTFLTLASENIVRLRQSERLRIKEQISYSERIRDFKYRENSSKDTVKSFFNRRRLS